MRGYIQYTILEYHRILFYNINVIRINATIGCEMVIDMITYRIDAHVVCIIIISPFTAVSVNV